MTRIKFYCLLEENLCQEMASLLPRFWSHICVPQKLTNFTFYFIFVYVCSPMKDVVDLS